MSQGKQEYIEVFRGLKSEPDAEIGRKGHLWMGTREQACIRSFHLFAFSRPAQRNLTDFLFHLTYLKKFKKTEKAIFYFLNKSCEYINVHRNLLACILRWELIYGQIHIPLHRVSRRRGCPAQNGVYWRAKAVRKDNLGQTPLPAGRL